MKNLEKQEILKKIDDILQTTKQIRSELSALRKKIAEGCVPDISEEVESVLENLYSSLALDSKTPECVKIISSFVKEDKSIKVPENEEEKKEIREKVLDFDFEVLFRTIFFSEKKGEKSMMTHFKNVLINLTPSKENGSLREYFETNYPPTRDYTPYWKGTGEKTEQIFWDTLNLYGITKFDWVRVYKENKEKNS